MTSADHSNPAASTAAPRPALRRDDQRRLLLGVCAGIARVLDADPALVRAAWIVLGVFVGPLALVAYVATAVIVPRDDGRMLLSGDPPDRRESRLGWGGVVVASILLLASAPAFHILWFDEPLSSPLLVAALVGGVIVLARANRDRAGRTAIVDAAASEAPTAVADAEAAPSAPTAAMVPVAGMTIEYERASGPGRPTPPQPAAPRGRSVFVMLAGAIVSGAAIAVVLDASGAVDLRAATVAVLLGAGALIAGATAAVFAGRRGTGATLALGILLALAAAGVAAIGPQLDDGVGYRAYRPVDTADLQPEYRLGLGLLELDLRDTTLPAGSTTAVKADVGAGHIELRVPADVQVEPVGDTSISGPLAPVIPTAGGRAPVVRIDGHTNVGGPLEVIRAGR